MSDDRQKKGTLPESKRNDIKKVALIDEMNLLNSIKAVAGTKEGMDFIKWIMELTKPLDDTFTGNAGTYYALGMQHVGKKIMFKLAAAGCELKLTDLLPMVDVHNLRMSEIHMELNKLQEKKPNGR